MEEYSVIRDVLDTYQSQPDWLKLVWTLLPPVIIFGLAVIFLRYRLATKRLQGEVPGKLVGSIYRDKTGHLRIVKHKPEAVLEDGMEKPG